MCLSSIAVLILGVGAANVLIDLCEFSTFILTRGLSSDRGSDTGSDSGSDSGSDTGSEATLGIGTRAGAGLEVGVVGFFFCVRSIFIIRTSVKVGFVVVGVGRIFCC